MATPVSTADAKLGNLSGSNSYKHILYVDEFHRAWKAVYLNDESLKVMLDAVLVKHRHELLSHAQAVQQWLHNRTTGEWDNMPVSQASNVYGHYLNYENVKIACGFEMNLKARLLVNGYIVHIINRKDINYKILATEQEKRPILVSEMQAICDFQFDGTINFLPGIKSKSLSFEKIIKEDAYKQALGLTDNELYLIEYFRVMRNSIHLPGECGDESQFKFSEHLSKLLSNYINNRIVDMSNYLIDKWNLRFQKVDRLT